MRYRVIAAALITLAAGTSAFGQQRFEIQPFGGVRFEGGFNVDESLPGAQVPVDINVDTGVAWGTTIGFNITDNFGVEFLWSRQETSISAQPLDLESTTLFDASVSQYHGNALFHFLEADARVRPYLLLGAGATNVDPDLSGAEGITKFSFGLGGGVKAYFSEHVGARFQARWTPTYVSSEPALWCDVFGFCYVVDEADYANQGEVTGGVTFRF